MTLSEKQLEMEVIRREMISLKVTSNLEKRCALKFFKNNKKFKTCNASRRSTLLSLQMTSILISLLYLVSLRYHWKTQPTRRIRESRSSMMQLERNRSSRSRQKAIHAFSQRNKWKEQQLDYILRTQALQTSLSLFGSLQKSMQLSSKPSKI